MRLPIPLLKPKGIDPEVLKKSYEEIIASGQFTNFGPFYKKAVTKLEELYPNKKFILCNNGTTTLITILKATFPKGARIAIPSFTFVATINAVLEAGMVPVILPCSTTSWTLAYRALKQYADLYDGFISVSPFGNDPRYQYETTAQHLGKKVIFDCAAGWGQDFNLTKAPISVSLHATKNLPIGEGGLIIIEDYPEIYESLINFGLDEAKEIHYKNGFNGKMDEIHAAILLEQLNNPMIEVGIMETKETILGYGSLLSEFKLYSPDPLTPQLPVFHVGGDLDLLEERANSNWITTRRYYSPLLNKAFPEYTISGVDYHDDYFSKFIALPKDLSDEEFDYVIKSLKGIRPI